MSVTRTCSWSKSSRTQPTPAKPPPTTSTCGFWMLPLLDMLYLSLAAGGTEPLEQVVPDAESIRHGGQRRVDGPDRREDAGVGDVEIVELVCAAVAVEDRGRRIVAEAAGACLVRDTGN